MVLCFYVVFIEMRGQYGYLSAIEWPLLPVSWCIVHLISILLENVQSYACHGIVCTSVSQSHPVITVAH